MPIIRGRGVPVPYPFYILLVGTLATLLLFVQQPELATRVATALSLTSPTEAVKAAQVVLPDQAPLDVAEEPKRKRVAIVGAGASGSAAAFFLARAARQAENRAALPPNSLLDIVVYEAEDYIGGRECILSLGLRGKRSRPRKGGTTHTEERCWFKTDRGTRCGDVADDRLHGCVSSRRQETSAIRARREHLCRRQPQPRQGREGEAVQSGGVGCGTCRLRSCASHSLCHVEDIH